MPDPNNPAYSAPEQLFNDPTKGPKTATEAMRMMEDIARAQQSNHQFRILADICKSLARIADAITDLRDIEVERRLEERKG